VASKDAFLLQERFCKRVLAEALIKEIIKPNKEASTIAQN
jgi:hypothetical protein